MKKIVLLGLLTIIFGVGCVKQPVISPPQPAQQANISTSTTTPQPTNDVVSVSLGQQFTLRKGQTAKITNTGLEIKVTQFYNSPCPADVQCIWSGVGTALEYSLNDQTQKGIDLVQAFGYKVTIVKTDHKTYANIIVERMK